MWLSSQGCPRLFVAFFFLSISFFLQFPILHTCLPHNRQVLKLENQRNMFMNSDVHVHVGDGGTNKDGPSGGAAIATGTISSQYYNATHTHTHIKNYQIFNDYHPAALVWLRFFLISLTRLVATSFKFGYAFQTNTVTYELYVPMD